MKNGWQRKQLGELAELKGRIGWRGLTAKEYTKSGPLFLSVHSLNYGDYVDFRDAFHISEERYVESPEIMLQKDDVLICKDGAGIGKVGIVGELPDRTTINSSLLLIRSHKEILPKFLYRSLESPYFQQIVSSRLNGATTPHLYQRDITEFPIILPPLPEQQRIVSILDQAFEGIATAKANAEKNLQNARALFESYLQSVFRKRGKGWVDRQLASLCREITVGHVGPMKTKYKENGVPFLRSQNIRPFEVTLENVVFIDEAFHRLLNKSQLGPGDLAIVRTGYPGTAAVIPPQLPNANCADLVIVRPSPEVNPHFLAAFFNSSFGKQLVLGKIVGAAQKHFNITAAKEVMLHVPPIQEQNAIVDKVDSLREEAARLESIYERKLIALESLKKSLLHQAFTGNV